MYVPSHFAESRVDVLHDLIRTHPFGALVVLASDGLDANHIPFEIDPEPAPFGTLRGHVARANPVWRDFSSQVDALVMFQGAHAYISPAWYATKKEHGKVVPTWNYAVVHAHGPLRVIDDRNWLRRVRREADRSSRSTAQRSVESDRCSGRLHRHDGGRDRRHRDSDCETDRQMEGQSEPAGERSRRCYRSARAPAKRSGNLNGAACARQRKRLIANRLRGPHSALSSVARTPASNACLHRPAPLAHLLLPQRRRKTRGHCPRNFVVRLSLRLSSAHFPANSPSLRRGSICALMIVTGGRFLRSALTMSTRGFFRHPAWRTPCRRTSRSSPCSAAWR